MMHDMAGPKDQTYLDGNDTQSVWRGKELAWSP